MGIKDVFGKMGTGLKKGASFLGGKIKEAYDKTKAKIEFDKLEKKKKEYIISEFEKQGKNFVIFFKDGKTKNIKCLYDFENKILKLNYEVDKEKIEYFEDLKHQKYYIQDIDLNGDVFTCEYEDEELSLPLEKVVFTTFQPSTSVVNNYITDNLIHDDHLIKTKNSNINSNGATISNENNIGLHVHLPKQQ